MREMAAEGVLLAGGGRSILLQLAEPGIGHGVAHHSDYSGRPLDRLNGTLAYFYAIACGTAEESAAAIRRVNRAHGPVRAAGGEDTPSYSAFDPELQLWVAATLYDSAITMYELIYGPIEPVEAEKIYQECAELGTALQVPASLWPRDRAAFGLYWAGRLGELRTDATTRAVARSILYPGSVPIWMRPIMPLVRLVTAGLLSPGMRELFELPWTTRNQRRFDRVIRVTRAVYPTLPQRLRTWPRDHYLRQLRVDGVAA